MRLINQIWRSMTTVFGFICFGFGGLLLSMIIFPLIKFIYRDAQLEHKYTQKVIQWMFAFFLKCLRFLGTLDYQINHEKKLSQDKGCVIIANHPSLLDVIFIISLLPECICIVKQSLFKNFFIKGVLNTSGYIPNTTPDELLQQCDEKLQQYPLLIFPEGTRSTQNQPIILQRGAANIALRCKKDIRLINITCDPPFLTKQSRWYIAPKTKPLFTITIKEKIQIDDFLLEAEPITKSSRHLTHYLTKQLTR